MHDLLLIEERNRNFLSVSEELNKDLRGSKKPFYSILNRTKEKQSKNKETVLGTLQQRPSNSRSFGKEPQLDEQNYL